MSARPGSRLRAAGTLALRGAAIAVLLVATGAAVAGGALAGAYRFDAERADVIAAGVEVAGLPVGGLTPAEARAALERTLVQPLERPLRLVAGERSWTFLPSVFGVQVDVERAVERAHAASREGDFLRRTHRDVTGKQLELRVRLAVERGDAGVSAVVERIAGVIDRPAQDATLTWTPTSLRTTPARDGVRVRRAVLERQIAAAVVRPDGPRTIEVPTERVAPGTTLATLARGHPTFIVVSRTRKELRLYERLELVRVYRIAVGLPGYETPSGLYRIHNRGVNPSWHVPRRAWAGSLAGRVIPPGPGNPIKARWLGIHDGAGIHGTSELSSLGREASRGCIRMSVPDVIELYDRVSIGTPIYIG